jgi:hypothetical protein
MFHETLSPLFHAARANPQAVAVEEENLHAIASGICKQKQMAALRILLQPADDKRIETVEVG